MDPATDMYYYWLLTISVPVFYNLIFLVARFEFMYLVFSLIVVSVHGSQSWFVSIQSLF